MIEIQTVTINWPSIYINYFSYEHIIPPRQAWKNISFGLLFRNGQDAFVNGERISSILNHSPSLPYMQSTFLPLKSRTLPWLKMNMIKHWSFCRVSSRLKDNTLSTTCCREQSTHNRWLVKIIWYFSSIYIHHHSIHNCTCCAYHKMYKGQNQANSSL